MKKISLRSHVRAAVIAAFACAAVTATAATPTAQGAAAEVRSFRADYGVVLDSLQASLTQNGNTRSLKLLQQARTSLNTASDETLARVFQRSGVPDLTSSLAQMRASSALPRAAPKSAGLPSASPVISACQSNTHDSQTVYDLLIASQVTSGILAAATFVCTEDIFGENGSLACIPFAIADDIAQGLFAVASFCAGEDGGAKSDAAFDRLDHIHTDLANAQSAVLADNSAKLTAILNNSNTNKDTIVDAVNAARNAVIAVDNSNATAIVNNATANTTSIINNSNANTQTTANNINAGTQTIVNNENANREAIIGELHTLACELIRLLNTPDGQRTSSVAACKAQPGFPYSWNKK